MAKKSTSVPEYIEYITSHRKPFGDVANYVQSSESMQSILNPRNYLPTNSPARDSAELHQIIFPRYYSNSNKTTAEKSIDEYLKEINRSVISNLPVSLRNLLGSGRSTKMKKSVSSMSQNGIRHMVGGYKRKSISKSDMSNNFSNYSSSNPSNSSMYLSNSGMSKRMRKSYGRNMEKMEIKLPKIPNLDELLKWLGGLLGGTTTTKFPNEKMFDRRLAQSSYYAGDFQSPINPFEQARAAAARTANARELARGQYRAKNSKYLRDQREMYNAVADNFGYNPNPVPVVTGWESVTSSSPYVYSSGKKSPKARQPANANMQQEKLKQINMFDDEYPLQTNMFDPETEINVFGGRYNSNTPITRWKNNVADKPPVIDPKWGKQSSIVMINGIPSPHPTLKNKDVDMAAQWLSANPSNKIKNKTQLIRDKILQDELTGGPGFGLPGGMTKDSIAQMQEWMKNNGGMNKRAKSSKVSKRADGPNKNKYF